MNLRELPIPVLEAYLLKAKAAQVLLEEELEFRLARLATLLPPTPQLEEPSDEPIPIH